jgi:hypothetical protein
MMKVKELIEILEQFNPEADVVLFGLHERGYSHIDTVDYNVIKNRDMFLSSEEQVVLRETIQGVEKRLRRNNHD